MKHLTLTLALTMLLLAGCSSDVPQAVPDTEQAGLDGEALAERCKPSRGWHDGLGGIEAPAACGEATRGSYLQAWRLGDEVRQFELRISALEGQAEASDDAADQGRLRREIRQIQVDIEAIRGAAIIEGWQADARPDAS